MQNTGSHACFLRQMFDAAVKAALPATCLPKFLPMPEDNGRLVFLAAGKAAGAMLEATEQYYADMGCLSAPHLVGLGVTRYGYGKSTRFVDLIEAGHPVPDEAGIQATERCIALARDAGITDHVVVLLSGGGSANWIAPVEGVSLEEKQALTRALLRSGATIDEINTVRKHLSRIKGGRLTALAAPAKLTTLAISDVPGDDATAIASGPTVPDPSTLEDARRICAQYDVSLPLSVSRALSNPGNESLKSGNAAFSNSQFHIIAKPRSSLEAAAQIARQEGFEVIFLGDHLEGEARDVAASHAELACSMADAGKRVVLLSGGELTVTLSGNGCGGPNQEYALALALHLAGKQGISALAADTDGTDGGQGNPDDPAGAFVFPNTLKKAASQGHDAASFLERNDSSGFFAAISDLLVTGPTYTNVNDFRAIIVDMCSD